MKKRRIIRRRKKQKGMGLLALVPILAFLLTIGILIDRQLIDLSGDNVNSTLSTPITTETPATTEDATVDASTDTTQPSLEDEATNEQTEEPTGSSEETITETSISETEETIPETEPATSETEETIPPQNDEETLVSEPTGIIYLTFDDGPSTEITPQILDILKEKDVKATFFIVGYTTGSERGNLVNREIAEGHTVALHGTSHDYSAIYSSLDALTENFISLQEKVFNDTGYLSTIIRFPGGSSNTVSKKYCTGIMTAATEHLSELGFTYFDWNVDSEDAGSAHSSQEVYENVTSTLVKGRSNVVLMHDSSSKVYTLGALESIIDFGLENGYEFRAINSDTSQVKHKVSN